MKILGFVFVGALLFALFLVAGHRASLKRIPDELREVTRLLSNEWRLVSWNRQSMGWLGKFEARGRRFDVSSHRGDIEIYELVDGTRREFRPTENPKSPAQI